MGSEKEDLPRGKARWREREETIDRGGGGARAGYHNCDNWVKEEAGRRAPRPQERYRGIRNL